MARKTRSSSSGGLFDFLSFVAIIVIGIGLLFIAVLQMFNLSTDLLTQIVDYVQKIIQILAILFIAYNSYFYAKSRSKTWYIIWVVAVIITILALVLSWGIIKF